jgi:hypothetical protein
VLQSSKRDNAVILPDPHQGLLWERLKIASRMLSVRGPTGSVGFFFQKLHQVRL